MLWCLFVYTTLSLNVLHRGNLLLQNRSNTTNATSLAPSTAPSRTPSVTPTFEPSESPEATMAPSNAPWNSTSAPSSQPSWRVSLPCDNFIFGTECDYLGNLDLLLILDGNVDSDEFYAFTGALADAVNESFPTWGNFSSRLGILQYSDAPLIVQQFDARAKNEDLALIIRTMRPTFPGQTWTQFAFDTAFHAMWEPTLGDEKRTRVTWHVGSHKPYEKESPCDTIRYHYTNNRISTKSLAVGNSSVLDCDSGEETVIGNLTDAVELITGDFALRYCDPALMETPYNGGFARTNVTINGFATYENTDHDGKVLYRAYWDEVWTMEQVQDPEKRVISEVSWELYGGLWPQPDGTWATPSTGNSFKIYKNVPIECTDCSLIQCDPCPFDQEVYFPVPGSCCPSCRVTSDDDNSLWSYFVKFTIIMIFTIITMLAVIPFPKKDAEQRVFWEPKFDDIIVQIMEILETIPLWQYEYSLTWTLMIQLSNVAYGCILVCYLYMRFSTMAHNWLSYAWISCEMICLPGMLVRIFFKILPPVDPESRVHKIQQTYRREDYLSNRSKTPIHGTNERRNKLLRSLSQHSISLDVEDGSKVDETQALLHTSFNSVVSAGGTSVNDASRPLLSSSLGITVASEDRKNRSLIQSKSGKYYKSPSEPKTAELIILKPGEPRPTPQGRGSFASETFKTRENRRLHNILEAYELDSFTIGEPSEDFVGLREQKYIVDSLVPCYTEHEDVIIGSTLALALSDQCESVGLHRVWVLDDSPKTHPNLEDRVTALREKYHVHVYYFSRKKCINNENVNHGGAKSLNVNTAISYIFDQKIGEAPTRQHILTITDCDHITLPGYLSKVIRFYDDPEVCLVQTPQYFYNVEPEGDIFGNLDPFWYCSYQPVRERWEAVMCCGTNFSVRAVDLMEVGMFPYYTATEDTATSLELHSIGKKIRYLSEFTAAGQAPSTLKDIVKQRIRWMKGNLAIFFYRNAFFVPNLTFPQRIIMFMDGYAFLSTMIVLLFTAIPMLAYVLGVELAHGINLSIVAIYLLFCHLVFVLHYGPSTRYFIDCVIIVVQPYIWSPFMVASMFETLFGMDGCSQKAFGGTTRKEDGITRSQRNDSSIGDAIWHIIITSMLLVLTGFTVYHHEWSKTLYFGCFAWVYSIPIQVCFVPSVRVVAYNSVFVGAAAVACVLVPIFLWDKVGDVDF